MAHRKELFDETQADTEHQQDDAELASCSPSPIDGQAGVSAARCPAAVADDRRQPSVVT
jgi:hypothetical protein